MLRGAVLRIARSYPAALIPGGGFMVQGANSARSVTSLRAGGHSSSGWRGRQAGQVVAWADEVEVSRGNGSACLRNVRYSPDCYQT